MLEDTENKQQYDVHDVHVHSSPAGVLVTSETQREIDCENVLGTALQMEAVQVRAGHQFRELEKLIWRSEWFQLEQGVRPGQTLWI